VCEAECVSGLRPEHIVNWDRQQKADANEDHY
jgi:hypothetical protein